MIRIHCPECGAEVSAIDVNLERMVARCTGCNALFSCATQVSGGPARPERQKPSGLQVREWGGTLQLVRRWLGWHLLFLVPFCIAWDSFLIFWYATALSQPNIPWIMLVFPVAHVAVGVGLTYLIAASFINSTVVSLGQGTLSVRHGPLPWPGNVSLRSADLVQLFTVQKIGSKGARRYELCALLKDGSRVKLLDSPGGPDEAVYMEQQLEKQLGIVDAPVDGEFKG